MPFYTTDTDIIATEGLDYLPLSSECRTLEFTLSNGLQEQCSYIEILDDSIIEGDEFFTLKLSSANPQVILARSEATVTIVDDDDNATTPTTEMTPIPTGGILKYIIENYCHFNFSCTLC